MDLEKLRKYCLAKKGVTEEFPFNENTLVFKVMDKIFCLTDINYAESINLKCDPEKAVVLREEYEEVKPGYHMNKKHWNTVSLTGTLRDDFILEMVDNSYQLVVEGFPKSRRDELRYK